MQLHEKISFLRNMRGLSQEEMAEKMEMSLTGYAKIEHGKTDVQLSRLQKISEILQIDLKDLFSLSENMIFNANDYKDHSQSHLYINSSKEQQNQLIIQQKDMEIEYLKQQVVDLREMIEALKKVN
jgi:transcriptional regulator with XRE-family HTH domain